MADDLLGSTRQNSRDGKKLGKEGDKGERRRWGPHTRGALSHRRLGAARAPGGTGSFSKKETEQNHPVHRPLPPPPAPMANRRPPSRPRTGQSEQRLKEEGAGPPESQRMIAMGLLSLVGRVLFASIFLISVYQGETEFRSDGGPAAKYLEPKFNVFVKQVCTSTGIAVPHVQIKTIIVTTMYIRVFGGLMFILYSSVGAFLLLVYLAFITPVVYDFYNYEMGSPQFVQLFTQFSQNLALCGALLFFLGMKSSIPRRYPKRRTAKTKTT